MRSRLLTCFTSLFRVETSDPTFEPLPTPRIGNTPSEVRLRRTEIELQNPHSENQVRTQQEKKKFPTHKPSQASFSVRLQVLSLSVGSGPTASFICFGAFTVGSLSSRESWRSWRPPLAPSPGLCLRHRHPTVGLSLRVRPRLLLSSPRTPKLGSCTDH